MRLLREVTHDDTCLIIIDESATEGLLNEANAVEDHQKEQKHLTHLQHLEDLIVTDGQRGFSDAVSTLQKTHDHLLGKRRDGYSIQTKFDGSPSLIWGHDPATKKFFVGTKSFFNKTPKVNFTDADIEKNHGMSERLVKKLKELLKHLKEISPKEGIFQGDVMYTSDEVQKTANNHLSFTPNTLTYNVDKNSYEGQKIMKSKIGIAAHTHYEQMPNGELQAIFDIDMSQFKPSEDIHFLPTKLRGPYEYKSTDISKFATSLKNAQEAASKLDHGSIKDHKRLLLSYINNAVRNRKDLSTEAYISFMYSQLKKRMESLKMDRSKDKVKDQIDAEVQNIMYNKSSFEKLFKAHKHLQDAKNVLVNTLSKNSQYKETVLGEPSKPEGFVVSINGRPIKLVDRQHFSAANFDWNAKVNPSDNPLVLSFGRMNPPTTGHGHMIEKGADIARRIGAKQAVVASRTQDKNKNPLSPSQKLSWLKSMFPGKNISVAAPEQSTFVAQLQHFHNQGVKDITIVAGADRVPEFQNILAKYNGPGKLFDFRRARVVSSGDRDEEAKGIEGMSGSKMRKAAKSDDFQTFRTGVPGHVKDSEAQEMFHTLRAEMGSVKIGSNTPGHALAIYAKRTDKIGQEAKSEIQRRQRAGTWKGRSLNERSDKSQQYLLARTE